MTRAGVELRHRTLAFARIILLIGRGRFGRLETLMVRKALAIVLITASFTLAACNTVRGVGSDLQSVANEVDEET